MFVRSQSLYVFNIIIINAFHHSLEEAKNIDSKWVARIIMKQKDGSCVDIVKLLGNHMKSSINTIYPKKTSFLFGDFVGVDDSQKLTTNLIYATERCGTSIVVGTSKKEKGKIRFMTINFYWVKYRLSRPSSKRKFSDPFSQ